MWRHDPGYDDNGNATLCYEKNAVDSCCSFNWVGLAFLGAWPVPEHYGKLSQDQNYPLLYRKHDYIWRHQNLREDEASLIVPDFTNLVNGSSLLFWPLSCFLALSFYLLATPRLDGLPRIRSRKKRRTRPKKRELNELPNTNILKSGTIKLVSPLILNDMDERKWFLAAVPLTTNPTLSQKVIY